MWGLGDKCVAWCNLVTREARYVLDATNNDEAVERLRGTLMDCVELASATGL